MNPLITRALALLVLLGVSVPAFGQDTETPIDDFRARVESAAATQLEVEARTFRTAIEEAKANVADLTDQISAAAGGDTTELQAQASDAKEQLDALAERLQIIVNTLDDAGVDMTDYKVFLTEATGTVSLENMDADAALSLFQKWIDKGRTWLTEEGPGVLANLVIFLVIMLIFKVIAGIAGSITRRALSSSKLHLSELLKNFFVTVVSKVILVIGLLVALPYIGINPGPFLAGVGVAGFVIGFALQDTLANFAAGIMILIYRPYDVGDAVSAGGTTGKVSDMSLVSTIFLTPDNQKVVVPNGSIWGGTITNITANATRRVDLTIGVGYDDDLDKAAEVLMDEVTKHPLVLKDPAPVVKVVNLGDSSVDFVVRPWSKTSDYWDVHFDLTKSIKQRLDKEGLSIPYPQRDVHLIGGNAPS